MKQITTAELRNSLKEYLEDPQPIEIIDGRSGKVLKILALPTQPSEETRGGKSSGLGAYLDQNYPTGEDTQIRSYSKAAQLGKKK